MHHSDVAAARAPYGLSFPIEELILLRSWAEQRKLQLIVALDWVLDGAEFEELLILSAAGDSRRRTLTLWRTQEGVFAQTLHGRPHGFETLRELLSQVRPTQKKRSVWLQRLGLGS
jgi:hypothetical protein